jgi:fimbrial chaperone protein
VKKDGKEMLVVRNTGIVHARLSNVYWGTSNDNTNASLVLSEGFLGYVLPGSVMSWPLPDGSNIPDDKALFAQLADNTAPITIPHGQ